MESDPITLIHDALWDLIKNNTGVTDLVKDKNFINFNTNDRTPLKQNITPSDLPEIQIWSEAAGGARSSSDSHSMTRQFTIVIVTGSYQVHKRLFPLEWAIFCALVNWKDFLTRLRYKDEPFVINCRMLGASVGDSDPRRNRGISGWTSLWRCEVVCEFSTQLISASPA